MSDNSKMKEIDRIIICCGKDLGDSEGGTLTISLESGDEVHSYSFDLDRFVDSMIEFREAVRNNPDSIGNMRIGNLERNYLFEYLYKEKYSKMMDLQERSGVDYKEALAKMMGEKE